MCLNQLLFHASLTPNYIHTRFPLLSSDISGLSWSAVKTIKINRGWNAVDILRLRFQLLYLLFLEIVAPDFIYESRALLQGVWFLCNFFCECGFKWSCLFQPHNWLQPCCSGFHRPKVPDVFTCCNFFAPCNLFKQHYSPFRYLALSSTLSETRCSPVSKWIHPWIKRTGKDKARLGCSATNLKVIYVEMRLEGNATTASSRCIHYLQAAATFWYLLLIGALLQPPWCSLMSLWLLWALIGVYVLYMKLNMRATRRPFSMTHNPCQSRVLFWAHLQLLSLHLYRNSRGQCRNTKHGPQRLHKDIVAYASKWKQAGVGAIPHIVSANVFKVNVEVCPGTEHRFLYDTRNRQQSKQTRVFIHWKYSCSAARIASPAKRLCSRLTAETGNSRRKPRANIFLVALQPDKMKKIHVHYSEGFLATFATRYMQWGAANRETYYCMRTHQFILPLTT